MAAVAMHPAFRLQQQQHVLMMGMSLRQKMALSSPPMSDSSQTSDRPTLELTDDRKAIPEAGLQTLGPARRQMCQRSHQQEGAAIALLSAHVPPVTDYLTSAGAQNRANVHKLRTATHVLGGSDAKEYRWTQICDAIADFPEVGNVMTSGVHQKWREDGISHHHGSERVGQNIRGPCPETYIGETERSLKTRFLEHRRPSSNTSEVSQHIHIESPGHTVTLDKVRILDTEQDYFVRGVKEAVYIRAHQPSLNRDGGRYRLPATFDALLTSSRFRLPESQRLHHKSDEG
ncbi:hypothetical protein Bbelb_426470 [Branchiostoma belcheri]|nr:hypothetical protein Bbelb_426470 [Branchiostoma belcheri]